MDEIQPILGEEIYAQVGKSSIVPNNMEVTTTLEPSQFDGLLDRCRVVVAHAGIGTIISAQKRQKPLIIFPREKAFGEHRNDHQVATCAQFGSRAGIYVARNREGLATLLRADLSFSGNSESEREREQLLTNVRKLLLSL